MEYDMDSIKLSTEQPGHKIYHSKLVLMICCASIFIVALDSSIINVALPAITRDFNSRTSDTQWIVDAYTLTLAGFLISSGVLADRGGRKRFFRYGMIVFGIGSLLCSMAPTIGILISSRVIQGMGGSMLNPIALAIISSVFTEPAQKAKAMGVWGATLGIALALGPIAGGFLIEIWDWRAIFWINIPICILVVLCSRFLPESFGESERHLDLRGQILTIIAMLSLVMFIIELQHHNTLVLSIVAIIFVLSAGLAIISMRSSLQPFIDPHYFRNKKFTLANLCGFAVSCGQGVLVYSLSIYLQTDLGRTPLSAGMALLPLAVGTFLLSNWSSAAFSRWGASVVFLSAGILVFFSGGLLFLTMPLLSTLVIGVAVFIFGAGFGIANVSINATAVAGMGQNVGAAGGVASTSRQLGMSVGVALAGSVGNPLHGHIGNSWIMLSVTGMILIFAGLQLKRS